MSSQDCIFCKIASGEIPTAFVHEDDICVAFNDLDPQAPTHILVIPRSHIDSVDKAEGADRGTLGQLLLAAGEIARKQGFAENGYRIVINTNSDGGQTVFHLHVHVLAGRQMVFPPG
jgi:histidine triad (HIT) family protein